MEDCEITEELLIAIEGAANMMRGMQFDQSIPEMAKITLKTKAEELDELVDKYA